MGLKWPDVLLLLILGVCIGAYLYELHSLLIKKLNKITFMNYRIEFEILNNQIPNVKTVDDLRRIQLEFDQLYHKVTNHCQNEDMERQFRDAYTMIIDKMMEVYDKEMRILNYKVVRFGELIPNTPRTSMN